MEENPPGLKFTRFACIRSKSFSGHSLVTQPQTYPNVRIKIEILAFIRLNNAKKRGKIHSRKVALIHTYYKEQYQQFF